jgi:hypothetical protein
MGLHIVIPALEQESIELMLYIIVNYGEKVNLSPKI